MTRIANADMGRYVSHRQPFITNNKTAFGEYDGDLYIVYSYGKHFPMYVFDRNTHMWFGNSDKYSRTTSSHQTKAHPRQNIDVWLDTGKLQQFIAAGGYVNACADRIIGDANG